MGGQGALTGCVAERGRRRGRAEGSPPRTRMMEHPPPDKGPRPEKGRSEGPRRHLVSRPLPDPAAARPS